MAPHELVDRYFSAWNGHDPAAVAALFSASGTYEDPSTGGPLGREAIAAMVERLVAAFPDLRFEQVSTTGEAERVVVEWIMRGRNEGPLRPGLPPTQGQLELRGVDVFELDAGGIVRVRGYFDQKTMVEQLGLMALIQPVELGKAKFGYSMRVSSGNPAVPGVIALTWIRGRDEPERDRIRGHSRKIVEEFLHEPGFIGIVTGFTGDRGFTVTAWEDEAALQRGLAREHGQAMKELRTTDISPGVWTSVWQPIRINRVWTRCPACASLEDVSDDHRECSRCGAALRERPSIW